MRFANPGFLWLLLAVPIVLFYAWEFRVWDLPSFRFPRSNDVPSSQRDIRQSSGVLWTGVLRALTIAALIIALARPQKGLRSEEMTTKASDIMLCLDASRSMLSVDFKPKDRFQMAKSVMADFIKGREYDRLGLVLFAEHAITQCPLTLDRSALLDILDSLQVGAISPDQTAIGVGLATSVNRLKNSAAKSKVIVLVTDGANNAGTIDPLTAAKTAASLGIKVYTIGAGSPDGGLMPVDDPIMGRRLVPIRNDLDEDMLLRIASETGGKYFRATSSDALKTIFKEIDSLEKTDIKVKEYVDYEDLYIGFLIAAAAFLFAELFATKTVFRTLP